LQQRVCIKFCVKNGFNGVKMEMLGNCFGSDTLKQPFMSGLKKPLRGTRFNSWKEVREKSKTALMAIPTIEFQKCFESWIKRWYKCVATMGSALKRTISLLMNKICILKFSEWISGNFLMKVVLSNNTLTINKNSLIIVVYHKVTTIL